MGDFTDEERMVVKNATMLEKGLNESRNLDILATCRNSTKD